MINIISLITPMNKDFSIDYTSLFYIVNLHISYNNTNFLVNATTSESLSLSISEKISIIRFLRFHFGSRIVIYSGSCYCSTYSSLKYIERLNFEDVDFLLQITPYYSNPSSRGVVKHFSIISKFSRFPIIIYNVPKRTGFDISDNCLSAIFSFSNIIGIKDSSSSYLSNVSRIKLCHFYGKKYYCGDDLQILFLKDFKFDGLVSVLSNFFPLEFNKILYVSSYKINYCFRNLIFFLSQFLNPVLIKWLLSKFIGFRCYFRLPLCNLTKLERSKISSRLNLYLSDIFHFKKIDFLNRVCL